MVKNINLKICFNPLMLIANKLARFVFFVII